MQIVEVYSDKTATTIGDVAAIDAFGEMIQLMPASGDLLGTLLGLQHK